jgi:hypothetical protein
VRHERSPGPYIEEKALKRLQSNRSPTTAILDTPGPAPGFIPLHRCKSTVRRDSSRVHNLLSLSHSLPPAYCTTSAVRTPTSKLSHRTLKYIDTTSRLRRLTTDSEHYSLRQINAHVYRHPKWIRWRVHTTHTHSGAPGGTGTPGIFNVSGACRVGAHPYMRHGNTTCLGLILAQPPLTLVCTQSCYAHTLTSLVLGSWSTHTQKASHHAASPPSSMLICVRRIAQSDSTIAL